MDRTYFLLLVQTGIVIIINADEAEVILSPGSRLKILKVDRDSTLDIDGGEVKIKERIYAEVINE